MCIYQAGLNVLFGSSFDRKQRSLISDSRICKSYLQPFYQFPFLDIWEFINEPLLISTSGKDDFKVIISKNQIETNK